MWSLHWVVHFCSVTCAMTECLFFVMMVTYLPLQATATAFEAIILSYNWQWWNPLEIFELTTRGPYLYWAQAHALQRPKFKLRVAAELQVWRALPNQRRLLLSRRRPALRRRMALKPPALSQHRSRSGSKPAAGGSHEQIPFPPVRQSVNACTVLGFWDCHNSKFPSLFFLLFAKPLSRIKIMTRFCFLVALRYITLSRFTGENMEIFSFKLDRTV